MGVRVNPNPNPNPNPDPGPNPSPSPSPSPDPTPTPSPSPKQATNAFLFWPHNFFFAVTYFVGANKDDYQSTQKALTERRGMKLSAAHTFYTVCCCAQPSPEPQPQTQPQPQP